MTERVMVDIETLGTEPGAAILSVGAIRFDRTTIHDEFHRNVSVSSCQRVGLEIDAETLDWWLSLDSNNDVLTGGDTLIDVLTAFREFYVGADEIWAHSPSFDCAILETAYNAVGESAPWHYSDERDNRTVAALPVDSAVEREGEKHDALDDAYYQAKQVQKALQHLTATEVDA